MYHYLHISNILFRRCCIMLVLCLGICGWVHAEKVDLEKAERVAQRYLDSKQRLQTRTDVRLKYTATNRKEQHGRIQRTTTPQDLQDTVYYYIFNVNERMSGGFVIVAGDDAVRPVLGYSTNGNYDENNLPPNFAYWMDYLQQEIAYVQDQNLPQSETARQEWNYYLSGTKADVTDVVGPLLQTKWNQGAPYNNLCPSYAGSRCVTGCAATAMAQIMNYHRHPARGIGRSSAYTTGTLNINIPSVNFEINYDWANMRNSGGTTAQQQNAVATLMYHCGVSVKMDYAYSSGAYSFDVPAALTEHFGYDKSIQLLRRVNYDNNAWENMLKEQIDAGLPVFYTGYYLSAGEGHAFVCDGYDGKGMFHFNWGWGGLFDGFFVTTSLNPGTGGAGSGSGTYNESQEIIIHIKPDPNVDGGGSGNTTCSEIYTFNGGSGTSADPYLIATAGQLAKLAELVNECCPNYNDKYYKLINDIDLSEYGANWNNGKGWIPIGDYDCSFKGEFDGNKKKITGLYINNPNNYQYIYYGDDQKITPEVWNGLFGSISGLAKIKNIGIEGVNIKTGLSVVGGVAGHIGSGSSITGCFVSGMVSCNIGSNIGGIAGMLETNSNVSNCNFYGTVHCKNEDIFFGSAGNVGGIVGLVDESNVTNCYSSGTVSNNSSGIPVQIGGIAGDVLSFSSVTNCYSTSTVNGSGSNSFIGGVAGRVTDNCNVTNCYSTGTVSGNNMYYSFVGGVVGVLFDNSKITNCYATGVVSSNGDIVDWLSGGVGGVAGLVENNSTATNCVALNLSVKGIVDVGRVVGSIKSIWGSYPGTLSGMIAFCGISNGGGGAFVGENIAYGRGGESSSIVTLQTAAGFPVDFTRSPWTYEEGKLPGLFGETVEIPEHLRSSIDVSDPIDLVLNNTGSITVYPLNYVDDPDVCDKTFVFVVNGADHASLTFTCSDIGSHTTFIVAIYEDGSRSQPKEITFSISDRTPYNFDVISGLNAIVDYGSSVIIYPVDFVENVTDNCSTKDNITFLFVVGGDDHTSLTYTCNDIGYQTVSIVAIDGRGNRILSKEANFMVQCRMFDFEVISGKDIVLNDFGSATVYPVEFVANVSNYDDITFLFDVGGDRTSLTFTCNDIGSHTTFIVATDGKGNRSLPQEVTFTINDRTPPVFDVTPSQNIKLDNISSITVYPVVFVTYASDNCGEITFQFVVGGTDYANLSFTCADIGLHTVSVVAIDRSGNRSQPKEVTITISEQTPPDFDIISGQDITLDNDGNINVDPVNFVTNVSYNDGVIFHFVDNDVTYTNLTFTCNDIGSHTVSIIAIVGKCSHSQPKEVTFTISEQTPPIAHCNPVTLRLSGDGKAILTAMMVDNGSTDDCGIVTANIKRDSDSDDLYANSLEFGVDDLDVPLSVTLRVSDASGNEATCTSSVRILEHSLVLGDISGIFTPNGDGFNDTWEIPGIDQYPEATVRIFNRAQKLMVELKGAQMPWDGRDRNGTLLESGYYLYQIELRRGGKIISGYVTILR